MSEWRLEERMAIFCGSMKENEEQMKFHIGTNRWGKCWGNLRGRGRRKNIITIGCVQV